MTSPYEPPVRRHILDDHTDPGLVDEVQGHGRTIGQLERRIDQLQGHTEMIDPKEFGRMQSDVGGLRRDFDHMRGTLDGMLKEMQHINRQMSEARGGWKMLAFVGGGAGISGGLIVKFLMWLAESGPKG